MAKETSLESAINFYLTEQPELFRYNRVRVLDYLFCWNGTGIEWQAGTLFCHEGACPQEPPVFDLEAELQKYLASPTYADVMKVMKHFGAGNVVEREEARARKRIMEEKGPKELSSFYPISKYSAVCNIPDNVKVDWLYGAFEVLDSIISLDATGDAARNQAQTIKEELMSRFSSRLNSNVSNKIKKREVL